MFSSVFYSVRGNLARIAVKLIQYIMKPFSEMTFFFKRPYNSGPSRIKGRQRYPAETRWQNVYAIHCIEIYPVDFKQLAPGGKDARKMLESGGMNQSLFMR